MVVSMSCSLLSLENFVNRIVVWDNSDEEINMVNILILEDELVFARDVSRIADEVFPENRICILPSVPSALEVIPDIAILDIGLEGEKDGIQFMREYGSRIPAILFHSIYTHRMKDSFGPNVLGFVEKGEEESVLREKLLLAKQRLESVPVAWLQDEQKRMVPIRTDLICSCSRLNRVVWITDVAGRSFRTKSGKFDECKEWMDDHFIWINQSEAINLHQIRTIDKDQIVMNNGHFFYMSRRYRRKLESRGVL